MESFSDTKMELSPAVYDMVMFHNQLIGEKRTAESNARKELTKFDYKHYEPKKNDRLYSNRKEYLVDKVVGRGTFGAVVKCWDTSEEDSTVAIKVIKPIEKYTGGLAEVQILLGIRLFQDDSEYLIKMVDVFSFSGRLCIVLEMMEMSLYDFYMRKSVEGQYLDMSETRRILHDILMGLVEFKRMGLIHADIKPQNVMLKGCGSTRTLRAKLIDFGLAHSETQRQNEPFLQTLPYRSPEMILHSLPYTEAIDMWSVGCIVGELLRKRELYPGRCEFDQLRYMIEHLCLLPTVKMLKEGLRSSLFFVKTEKKDQFMLKSPLYFLATVAHDGRQRIREEDVIYERQIAPSSVDMILRSIPKDMEGDDLQAEITDRQELRNLMRVMLKVDQNQRISPERALEHSFFRLGHLRPYTACNRVRESFYLMGIPIMLKKQRRSSHNSCRFEKIRSPAA